MATTFKHGDPSFAGSLGGVALGLASYHILELKELISDPIWEREMTMYELEIDEDKQQEIIQTMEEIRKG